MMEKQGVTEDLKARDQMVWVGVVNNIRNAAEEMVLKDLCIFKVTESFFGSFSLFVRDY